MKKTAQFIMDNIPKLVISEKFYSIQGEGQTMGIPAVFIRLAGCNLLCKSSSWECDSIEVWQKGVPVDFNLVLDAAELSNLRDGAHLVLTGGEPLLHQAKIIKYLEYFKSKYGFLPKIEVETNGTILPHPKMLTFVDYWNCSPKLSNSGETEKRRINREAIYTLNDLGKNVIFKFVIKEDSDVIDLLNDYGRDINTENIVLMPAGETQEELNKVREDVVKMCLEMGFRYSDRLHIVIWNKKTGV